MIRAIFFDVGGVLKSGLSEANALFAQRLNISFDEYQFMVKQYFLEINTGKLTRTEFFNLVRKKFSIQRNDIESLWEKTFLETHHENTETRNFALSLKQKYVVGIITNVSTLIVDYNSKKGVYDGFDPVILSTVVGMVKPDKNIFQEANRLSHTQPNECIFIDDKPLLVEKAREYGFHCIQYHDLAQLKKEFEKIIELDRLIK